MSLQPARVGILLCCTGALHCGVGILIPELRKPLIQTLTTLTVEHPNLTERYARECTVWFQISGLLMVLCGYMLAKSSLLHDHVVGWSLVIMGGGLATIMPVSGAWLILALGGCILFAQDDQQQKIKKL